MRIEKKKSGFIRGILPYLHDMRGTIMAAFAVMLPAVVGSVGMTMDLSQAYLVRQRLAGALDASALAAAASSTDENDIRERIVQFFEANYPENVLGDAFDLEVEFEGDDVIVSAKANHNTSFMKVLGFDHMTIGAETIVRREVRGLEVALVLDNTGSMSTNDNIGTLRTATESFINILFDRASDPEDIRIGLVPYANAVRVGRYGLGLYPNGDIYYDPDEDGTADPFVELPADVYYTDNHNTTDPDGWYGCVVEYNEDGWDEASTANDPYPHDVLDDYEGSWDPYLYEQYSAHSSCGQYWDGRRWRNNTCYHVYTYPNNSCPYANVVPLTSDQDALLSAVATMQAHGNTLGNIGMAWGTRLISPDPPFTEGHAWDDPRWRKAIIMMTDGVNTRDSSYSAFWRSRNHQLGTTDYNERFVETCDAMRAQGVLVYTVTFAGGVSEDAKEYYRDCATSEAQYYDAPTQDELIEVFEKISRELANLHIRS